jgi:AraC-like DNA-binding protein
LNPETTSGNDLLGLVRFEARVYHNAKVCGNWLLREHAPGQTCFHVVTMGSCLVDVPGHLATTMQTGDLLFFTHELPHTMTTPSPGSGPQRHVPYHLAPDEEGTGLLCAEVTYRQRLSEYLLQSLPPVLLIRNEPDNAWLPPLLELIVLESAASRLFGAGITDRLCELLFSYALSHYLARHPSEHSLLSLYIHPRLATVITAIHQYPEAPWTLAKMAQVAAQSRTSFSKSFREISGWTPMQYVTWWRMQLAWEQLQEGKAVGAVAEATGYSSVAAFCRAFKASFEVNAGSVSREARRTRGAYRK